MQVAFTALAIRELDDAIQYLEERQSNLGQRFKNDVRDVAERLAQYPFAGEVERGEVRRCLLTTFPYKLLYAVEPDHIIVLAVAHQHRRPDYWVDRV